MLIFGYLVFPDKTCVFVSADEVFLLVARGDQVDVQKQSLGASQCMSELKKTSGTASEVQNADARVELDEHNLFFRHLGALFKKRAANFRRDQRACTYYFLC